MAEDDMCTECHGNGGYENLLTDKEGTLYCLPCGKETGKILQEYDSFNEHSIPRYIKGEIVVWVEDDQISSVWTDSGSTVFSLQDGEKKDFTVEDVFAWVEKTIENDEFRCSTCKQNHPMSELGGRPLFAGINCKGCWEIHNIAVENQRAKGDCCLRCRKPTLLCYC